MDTGLLFIDEIRIIDARDGKIPNGPFPYSCQVDFIKKSAGKYLPWQYFTMKYYILFIVWAESRKSNRFLA